jgi:hypothetical protein
MQLIAGDSGCHQRADDRACRRAGDLVELVAAFFEDRDCARQRNSFDTAALQNEVRVQRVVHFCPS